MSKFDIEWMKRYDFLPRNDWSTAYRQKKHSELLNLINNKAKKLDSVSNSERTKIILEIEDINYIISTYYTNKVGGRGKDRCYQAIPNITKIPVVNSKGMIGKCIFDPNSKNRLLVVYNGKTCSMKEFGNVDAASYSHVQIGWIWDKSNLTLSQLYDEYIKYPKSFDIKKYVNLATVNSTTVKHEII